MPTKWDLPASAFPPPPYCEAGVEVHKEDEPPKMAPAQFILACIQAALSCGCNIQQACMFTANANNETAYGQKYRAWNLGGVKIYGPYALAYKAEHKAPSPWWRAPGNRAPNSTYKGFEGATETHLKGGDGPWCFYRGYPSLGAFVKPWIRDFTPKPGTVSGRYKKTGAAFWNLTPPDANGHGDFCWEICASGYKGQNTENHPDASATELRSGVREAETYYAQSKLKVVVDGHWGPKSTKACQDFQGSHGLPTTGVVDTATLLALAAI